MASRKRCTLGLSNKNSRMENGKDQTFLDLPSDLLQLVMSCLPLKDNIRASTVCKTWHEACLSVRVADRSPWLIYFSKTEESCELYDPSTQKTYNLEFPELSGFRVCHSKDGWLLMHNPNSLQLFFFNPFTRDRIAVPRLWLAYDQRVVFSCAPTSTSCLLFTSYVYVDSILMKTCRPNAEEWNTIEFKSLISIDYDPFEQIVFSNGVVYCLANTENIGCLSIFDPSLNSWRNLPGVPFKHPGSNGCFMTEHQGKIFVIYMYDHMNPIVFKLDTTSNGWSEMKTLGGLTIYASALSSETRAEQKQPSGIRNCLCLSVFHGFKRSCIYHKVDEEESTNCFKWKKYDPYANIWIMPPLNLLDLPFFDQLL